MIPPANANPTSHEAEKAIRNRLGAQAPQDSHTVNDGLSSKTYDHFGYPPRHRGGRHQGRDCRGPASVR